MIIKGSLHIGNFIYLRCASNTEDTVDDIRLYASGGEYIVERCITANATKGGGTWEATGESHDRLHKITSNEDHQTEEENALKLAGWDQDGVPEAKQTKELSTKELKTIELKTKLLELPHVISDTAPDVDEYTRGTYWYKPPVDIYILEVQNDIRAWLDIGNLKVVTE